MLLSFLDTKESTHLGQLGSMNLSKVITYNKFICAMAYQMIDDVLKSVWGVFNCSIDGGNKSNCFLFGR